MPLRLLQGQRWCGPGPYLALQQADQTAFLAATSLQQRWHISDRPLLLLVSLLCPHLPPTDLLLTRTSRLLHGLLQLLSRGCRKSSLHCGLEQVCTLPPRRRTRAPSPASVPSLPAPFPVLSHSLKLESRMRNTATTGEASNSPQT